MEELFRVKIEMDTATSASDAPGIIAGTLVLQATQDAEILNIRRELLRNLRGKMSSSSEIVDQDLLNLKHVLPPSQRVTAGETYRIPFSFAYQSIVGTYKGHNVSIGYEVKFSIKLSDASFDELDKSFFRKMKSFVTGDRSLKYSQHIFAGSPTGHYQVATQSLSMKANALILMGLGVALLLGALGYFMFEPQEIAAAVALIVASLIGGGILSLLITRALVGEINLRLENIDEKNFSATVSGIVGRQLFTGAELYYQVTEIVTDRRGTSSSTYRSEIFKSKEEDFPLSGSSEKISFKFPQQHHIASLELRDVKIAWEMYLILFTSLGENIKCKGSFHVVKKISPPPDILM